MKYVTEYSPFPSWPFCHGTFLEELHLWPINLSPSFCCSLLSCGGIMLETAALASSDLIIKHIRDSSVLQRVVKESSSELLPLSSQSAAFHSLKHLNTQWGGISWACKVTSSRGKHFKIFSAADLEITVLQGHALTFPHSGGWQNEMLPVILKHLTEEKRLITCYTTVKMKR